MFNLTLIPPDLGELGRYQLFKVSAGLHLFIRLTQCMWNREPKSCEILMFVSKKMPNYAVMLQSSIVLSCVGQYLRSLDACWSKTSTMSSVEFCNVKHCLACF